MIYSNAALSTAIISSLITATEECLPLLYKYDIDESYFSDFFHKEVFITTISLHKLNNSIPDEMMIYSSMVEKKVFQSHTWNMITDDEIVITNIETYIRMFKQSCYKRELRNSYKFAKSIDENTSDEEFEKFTQRIRENLLDAEKKNPANIENTEEMFDEIRNDAKAILDGKVPEAIIDMSFIDGFDREFTKIERGEYWTIAARTSVGKTSFVAQIVKQNLIAGKKIIVHPLESNMKEFCRQIAAQTAKINYNKINEFPKNKIDLYFRTIDRIQEIVGKQIFFYKNRSLEKLNAFNDSYFLKYGRPDVIILDYIQLVESGNHSDNRATRLGVATSEMKNWAGKYDCLVIALAQVKRLPPEQDRRPTMNDLRESGTIEQDSNRVTFLHMPVKNREGKEQRHQDIREIELFEEKCRFGRPGFMKVKFNAPITSFYVPESTQGTDY